MRISTFHLLWAIPAFALLSACNEKKHGSTTPVDTNLTDLTPQNKTIDVDARGYGKNRNEAIIGALIQARDQTYGMRITKAGLLLNTKKINIESTYEKADGSTETFHLSSENHNSNISATGITADIISYEVLSESGNDNEGWDVCLRIKMYAPYEDRFLNKTSLVINKESSLAEQLSQFGFPDDYVNKIASDAIRPVKQAFEESGDFVFLNRNNNFVSQERNLLKDSQTASSQLNKANQQKVADFVLDIRPVTGTFNINKQVFPDTGQIVYRGQWNLDLKIIMTELASNVVVASSEVSISGKKSSFNESQCRNSCLENLLDQLNQKVKIAIGNLTFRLGYPQLSKGQADSISGNHFFYHFQMTGPYLLSPQQVVELIPINSNRPAIKAVVISVTKHNSVLFIKTEEPINQLTEQSVFVVSPLENHQ